MQGSYSVIESLRQPREVDLSLSSLQGRRLKLEEDTAVVGWGWAEPSKFTPASLIVLLGGACHQA